MTSGGVEPREDIVTYTWVCDQFGCLWQASSESREEAHAWATEHTDLERHPVSLYVEAV